MDGSFRVYDEWYWKAIFGNTNCRGYQNFTGQYSTDVMTQKGLNYIE